MEIVQSGPVNFLSEILGIQREMKTPETSTSIFIVELQVFFFPRNLSDLDKDGQLNIEEFAIAMHFVEVAKVGQALPPTVPQELLPLAYQSRQVSANNMALVQEGRERSDSGLDRSSSERERSGSIDGKSRSGSITVCKSSVVSQEL